MVLVFDRPDETLAIMTLFGEGFVQSRNKHMQKRPTLLREGFTPIVAVKVRKEKKTRILVQDTFFGQNEKLPERLGVGAGNPGTILNNSASVSDCNTPGTIRILLLNSETGKTR